MYVCMYVYVCIYVCVRAPKVVYDMVDGVYIFRFVLLIDERHWLQNSISYTAYVCMYVCMYE